MKKVVLSFVLALSLLSFVPTHASAAKAEYCYTALLQCVQECRSTYAGLDALAAACSSGCNIGYLMC